MEIRFDMMTHLRYSSKSRHLSSIDVLVNSPSYVDLKVDGKSHMNWICLQIKDSNKSLLALEYFVVMLQLLVFLL